MLAAFYNVMIYSVPKVVALFPFLGTPTVLKWLFLLIIVV